MVDGKRVAIRIVGTAIMVRVGGGWEELEKYLSSPSAVFFKQCGRAKAVELKRRTHPTPHMQFGARPQGAVFGQAQSRD
jgi:hypothetical protein